MGLKRLALLVVLTFAGVAGWQIVSTLSSDALGMAVGVIFGILAGVPAALLIVAAGRRAEQRAVSDMNSPGYGLQPYSGRGGMGFYPQQPPVIVLTGAGVQSSGFGQGSGAWGEEPQPSPWNTRPRRRFQVVGDEEGIEEW